MIEEGFMVELTRPSSKGGVKKFKSITGEGLNFGENQVNPSNPKSTQPLYYEDKFIDLLVILQLKQVAWDKDIAHVIKLACAVGYLGITDIKFQTGLFDMEMIISFSDNNSLYFLSFSLL